MSLKNHPLAALRAAFPHTVPVLTGFGFLGAAYGILLSSYGYGPLWAFATSLFVFAGSMQYLALGLLTLPFDPVSVFLLTLTVNARHLFYGVSRLETFRSFRRVHPYLIFAMCDETFSLYCSAREPEGIDREQFLFWIAALDQFYWVAASTLGGCIGSVLQFDTTGYDFVLTALFVVILLGQWKDRAHRIPALVGLAGTAACLIIFGAQDFLIPSMGLILIVLLLIRRPLERRLEGGTPQ